MPFGLILTWALILSTCAVGSRGFAANYSGPTIQNGSACPVYIHVQGSPGFPMYGFWYGLGPGQVANFGIDYWNFTGNAFNGNFTVSDVGTGGLLASVPSVQRNPDGSCSLNVVVDGCDGSAPPIDDRQDRPPHAKPPCGMPDWTVSEPYMSLWIEDSPLFYDPSFGPKVALNITYKQREFTAGEIPSIFGVGRKWNCSWLSFVSMAQNTNPVVLLPDGGQIRFYTTNDYLTHSTISGDTTNGFTVNFPDGSSDFYGFIVTSNSVFQEAFLTELRDPQSQKVRLNYATYNSANPVVQLTSIVDADGHTTSVYYNTTNWDSTNLISQVTDPFGRNAYLGYDTLGRLTNITDVYGIETSFQYDGLDRIVSMTTPYGTTSFSMTESNSTDALPSGRSILISEPDNTYQLYYCKDSAPGVAGSYATNQVPNTAPFTNTFENSNLSVHDTFHWGPQQYAALSTTNLSSMTSSDFSKAHLKHWLLSGASTVGETLSVERLPSPDSAGAVAGHLQWYDYIGKTNVDYQGTNCEPLFVADVLPGGSTRCARTERNMLGLPLTQITTYGSGSPAPFRTNVLTYAANGIDLLTVTNAVGVQILSNSYNGFHQILTHSDALGELTSFSFNTNQQLVSIALPTGLVSSNSYFVSGANSNRLASTVDYAIIGGGFVGYRTNSYTWQNGLVATHTDPLGLTTTNTWDNLQRLRRVDYSDGTSVTNEYLDLDLVQVVDRMHFSNSFAYDSLRRLTAVTNANNTVTMYGYCSCGSLSSVTNGFGTSVQAVTSLSWDLQGHLLQLSGPDAYTLTWNYNSVGQVTNITDGLTSVTNSFNNQGLLMASSNAFGLVSGTTFDILNRPTNTINGNSVTITNTFDNLNRLSTRGYPDGGVERFGYSFGTLAATSYTNQLLTNIVNYLYDALGRKTGEVYVGLRTNQFGYDGANDLTKLTDGNNNQTTWHYDQFGRTTNKVDATGTEIIRYGYDADNRLTNRWTAAKGNNTTYQYDGVGNLTNVVYPSTSLAFAYDPLNRLTNMVDSVGTTRFSYTTAGLLQNEDGPWNDDTVTYAYNSARLRTSMSLLHPSASPWAQTYEYDNAERLTGAISPAGSFGYLYDPARHLQTGQLTLPNSAYITNTFDSVARMLSTVLESSTNGILNSHVYGYNVAGQRMALTNTAGDFRSYGYESIGQLTAATGSESNGSTRWNEQFQYIYDAAGNLAFRTNNGLFQTFVLNSLNELSTLSRSTNMTVAGTTTSVATNVTVNGLTASIYADATFARTKMGLVNGTNTFTAIAGDSHGRQDTNVVSINLPATNSFTYDLNGNLLSDGIRNFTYDDENQLISVWITNNWRSDFIYDGKMRRRVRLEYTWGGSSWVTNAVVRYVYDGMLVVQERDGNNLPLVTYTRGRDLSGSLQGAGGIGGLLARSDNGMLSTGNGLAHAYYHSDANGNITCLINGSQGISARYLYDPYGNTISQSGPLAAANLYRFSTKEVHAASGLTYFLLRYYDSSVQRWLNRDPSEEAGGIDLYQFVGNNPINQIDPIGLCYGDWWDPRTYFQEGLNGLWTWLYTGDVYASEEEYKESVDAAGDYVYDYGGVRGFYGGIGLNGKQPGYGSLAGQVGLTGTWTVDTGYGAELDAGFGLQERGQNSLGIFTSQTVGGGGSYQFWSQATGFQAPSVGSGASISGPAIYGGTANSQGGANFVIQNQSNAAIGINYGPAYGGLIVNPSLALQNFIDSYHVVTGTFNP
jgi:RHS repeat-associated protein